MNAAQSHKVNVTENGANMQWGHTIFKFIGAGANRKRGEVFTLFLCLKITSGKINESDKLKDCHLQAAASLST